MESWRKIRIGDACKTNTDSYSHKEEWDYINYLDTGNITDNRIASIQYIDAKNEKLPSRAKRKVKKDSIIYSMVRPNQRHFGIIKTQPENFLVSTGFVVIDTDDQVTQSTLVEALHAIAEQSTSTYPSIKPSDIEDLEIEIPDFATQKKIADILGSLDRKITQNMKVNDNLIQQITACFHHHFDAYEASTDAIGVLGDVAQFKYGTMPKKEKLGRGEYVAFSGYQVVGSYPEKMYSTPQLIIVARGVGGCGDIKYTPSNCYLTNLSIAILPQNTAIEDYLFIYLRLHDTKVMNTGSAQPQITVSTLEKYQLPIPPKDRLASFSTFVQPFKILYRKNKTEIERLQMLRDTLLPRLMSGELDVSNIDI